MKKSYSTIYSGLLICAIFVSASGSGLAQEKGTQFHQSAIYIELLGQGVLYSINYDYRINPQIGLRAGFTSWSFDASNFNLSMKPSSKNYKEMTGFPLMVNYLSGEKNSHLELGIGVVLTTRNRLDPKISTILFAATLGYRSQPQEGGFVFRVGFTPLFTFNNFMLPWIGLSFGTTL